MKLSTSKDCKNFIEQTISNSVFLQNECKSSGISSWGAKHWVRVEKKKLKDDNDSLRGFDSTSDDVGWYDEKTISFVGLTQRVFSYKDLEDPEEDEELYAYFLILTDASDEVVSWCLQLD